MQWPQPCGRPLPSQASTGDSWTLTGKSGSVSCGVTAPFPGSWCSQGSVCALPRVCVPVLCKFWLLYGGANGDLLQERLCHTQVCCIQSPRSCGSLLLTHTSTRDTQTRFYLSFFRVSGSWCAHGFLSPLSISAISVSLGPTPVSIHSL